MKQSFFVLSALLSTTFSWAGPSVSEGPGPVGTYADCAGQLEDGTPVSFEVRATAAIGFIDSVLINTQDNSLIDQLSCKKGQDIAPGAPSAGRIDWVCVEYRNDYRMGYSVEIMTGGVTGVTTAQVKQEQIFPLAPKVMGTLFCNLK